MTIQKNVIGSKSERHKGQKARKLKGSKVKRLKKPRGSVI